MKKLLLTILLIFPLVTYAAGEKPVKYKTLLREAKAAIKNKRNQANAEKNLLDIVNRPDIKKDQRTEIYFMAQELERSQWEAENMKFYLKQPYDTTKFFSTILKMYEYLLVCDSLDLLPNEKGLVGYKYRVKNREILLAYRSNLLNGGKFLLKRNRYAAAYDHFEMYIRSSQAPIFEHYPMILNDTLLARAAYWATVSAYNDNKPEKALRYIDRAIEGADSTLRFSLQEYKVRCLDFLGKKDERIEALVEGTRLYPRHDYFFLHLMDVYTESEQYDKGLALCDTLLSSIGDRNIYWLGKSQMYLAKGENDSCIVAADNALRCDTSMVDAYYNKGVAFLNKALRFAETACLDIRNPKCRNDRQTLQKLYREAKKPMEQVRRMAPDDSKRWASPLYRIYLNLNMGKEFAEMERLLNAQ